ncbi:ABC transporter substrate-binding protein [Bacillus horti]|uniref:ABC-type glycerol-3-phosphate transport system substrate-binding protein n=1 Tax=Caldalkalibacillus horti TaxID=77523 RepID=A0ABT9W563_9BACI|nr:extracellular solute-binding protein [Bacillus horti]MDQ0168381.1 ABC-type glycerol-3-phosphate transport system substrate-binding protein [Bacillus horti]
MKRNLWLGISLVGIIAILMYLWQMDQQGFNLTQETKPREVLELWTSNPETGEMAKRFEEETEHMLVNVRYFHNSETLLEELVGAVSATTPPDLAEISAHYGIYSLIEAEGIVALEDWLDSAKLKDLVPGIASRFQYDNALWAWPIGGSLPTIYVNQSMLESQGYVSPYGIYTWDDLWEIANDIAGIPSNGMLWGFHTDLQTPWYLRTMLKQKGTYIAEGNDEFEREALSRGDLVEWTAAVHSYQIMPPLTHHLAITEFVNGQGAFLLSSSEHISLIERLVAGKFDLDIIPIPYSNNETERERGYMSGGSGIVVLQSEKSTEQDLERATQFISFLSNLENARELSDNSNYIPALRSLMKEPNLNISTSLSKPYHEMIQEAEYTDGSFASEFDQDIWNRLLELQEEIESTE